MLNNIIYNWKSRKLYESIPINEIGKTNKKIETKENTNYAVKLF